MGGGLLITEYVLLNKILHHNNINFLRTLFFYNNAALYPSKTV